MEHLVKSLVLLLLMLNIAFGQGISAEFQIENGCRAQNLEIQNTSSGGDSFAWDFCADDFSNLKIFETVTAIGSNYGSSLKLVEDNGQWFGFGTFWNGGNQLVRFDFGDSPLNTPTVVGLGNPGGGLVFAESIDVVKVNGVWYGLVTNIDVGANVILLDFGTDLKSIPESKPLGNFGLNDRLFDVRIIVQGSDVIVVFVQFITEKISFLNFGSTFPENTSPVVTNFVVADAQFISGFDLFETNEGWKALVLSYMNNKLMLLDFSSGLLNTPVVVATYDSNVDKPYRVRAVENIGNYYLIVSGETNADVKVFNFFDFDTEPEILPLGTMNQVLGFDVARVEGKFRMIASGTTSNLKHAIFESDCGASTTYSNESFPSDITYSTSGVKSIELVVTKKTENLSDTQVGSITISNEVAPEISFTYQNVCAAHDINFMIDGTLDDITSYSWNFGDNNLSSDPEPTHEYATADLYEVRLIVGASNGCMNFSSKTLEVYQKPVSEFTVPSGMLCTNDDHRFTNMINDTYNGHLLYEWFVDGESVSNERDLQYTFSETGDHNVTLISSIPGCSDDESISISDVQTGPHVDFGYNGMCENQEILFSNYSTGEIQSFLWDLVVIETHAENPRQIFSAGEYNITLTAEGVNGCSTTTEKSLVINPIPIVDFGIENNIICNDNVISFFDLTQSDSELVAWDWNFGDNSSSAETRPDHVFVESGTFTTSLAVTTEAGCVNSIDKEIVVNPSPITTFSNSAACENMPVNFKGPVSESIRSFEWTIDQKVYETQDVTHIFRKAGSYSVALNVIGLNGCERLSNLEINVPEPIQPAFTVTQNCVDQPALFTDVTTGKDAVSQSQWVLVDFADTLQGNAVNYTFHEESDYTVTLNVVTVSGCSYSVSSTVPVVEMPTALFSMSSEVGAPPFPVSFTNKSIQADNYAWDFGDNNFTSEESPEHTFNAIGEFEIALTASNDKGCKDVFTRKIVMSPSAPDISLKALTATDNGDGSLQVTVVLENVGNTIVKNLPVVIDVSGLINLTETIEEPIQPSGRVNMPLSYAIPKANVKFLCATAELAGDINFDSNRNCLQTKNSSFVMPVFPNPVTDKLTIEWVAPADSKMHVQLFNAFGRVVFSEIFKSVDGLNARTFSVEALQKGIYLLVLEGNEIKTTQRVLLTR